jgi:hypothetical protein
MFREADSKSLPPNEETLVMTVNEDETDKNVRDLFTVTQPTQPDDFSVCVGRCVFRWRLLSRWSTLRLIFSGSGSFADRP